jgi:hypothetical protein
MIRWPFDDVKDCLEIRAYQAELRDCRADQCIRHPLAFCILSFMLQPRHSFSLLHGVTGKPERIVSDGKWPPPTAVAACNASHTIYHPCGACIVVAWVPG